MIDLTLAIRRENEFGAVRDCLAIESRQSRRAPRPLVVSGLCEGAEFAFLNNLRDLAADNGFHGILLVVSDEKKANRLCRWLGDSGKNAAFFALRDLVFYNASASHDFEHERLSLLLRMLEHGLDYAVTTPDALLQYTVPRARLRDVRNRTRRSIQECLWLHKCHRVSGA